MGIGEPAGVREIRPSEIDRLAQITVAAYTIAFADTDVGDYIDELADVADRVRHAVVLVAVDADHVLGGVTYVPDTANPYAEFEDTDAAGIRMLAVDPTAQGRGVGAALVVRVCAGRTMTAAVDRAPHHGGDGGRAPALRGLRLRARSGS